MSHASLGIPATSVAISCSNVHHLPLYSTDARVGRAASSFAAVCDLCGLALPCTRSLAFHQRYATVITAAALW